MTSFRLGRQRLAEDSGLKSSQLLKQPNTWARRYELDGKVHEVIVTLTLLERVDGGADNWSLELGAFSPPLRPPVKQVLQRPLKLLHHLGKLALEQEFYVIAGFLRPADQLAAPKVPAPMSPDALGGAFSHIVGYTLAKVGELGSVLYEVSIRDAGQMVRLDVGFTYKRVLDEGVFDAVLQRATQLVETVTPPKVEQAAAPPAAPEPAHPEVTGGSSGQDRPA